MHIEMTLRKRPGFFDFHIENETNARIVEVIRPNVPGAVEVKYHDNHRVGLQVGQIVSIIAYSTINKSIIDRGSILAGPDRLECISDNKHIEYSIWTEDEDLVVEEEILRSVRKTATGPWQRGRGKVKVTSTRELDLIEAKFTYPDIDIFWPDRVYEVDLTVDYQPHRSIVAIAKPLPRLILQTRP